MVHIALAFLAILGTYLHIKLADSPQVSAATPRPADPLEKN